MSGEARKDSHRSLGSSVLLVFLLIAAGVAVVWANLWKADLRIASVSVSGNTIVSDSTILSLAGITRNEKLYGIDLLAAQKRILQNAFVKSASVNREAPNRIAISVEERVPLAAVILDRIEYLDADGVVLPPVRSAGIFDLPVLTGMLPQSQFVPGTKIPGNDVNEALDILETARRVSDALYRRISEVHVEPGKDIVLYTAEYGVPVILGHGGVAEKLVKLDGFWKQIVLHQGADRLEYVDLRFEDQVVVRWSHGADETGAANAVLKTSPLAMNR